jgi:glutathione synthase
MRFVFVMDPLARVMFDKDTTFAIIQAAQTRGHQSFHCLVRDLSVDGSDVYASARPVEILPQSPWIVLRDVAAPVSVRLADVDAVFVRKDPPFDRAYLYATLQLERARGKTLIINDPRGLRDANEKLYTLNFPEWTPRTLVTSNRSKIHDFCREVGGAAVIKPLDGAGGIGVLRLTTTDKNSRSIVDILTHEGERLAIVQEFLPEVTAGDKRILVLDGEPLGAILRVPRGDDLRSNIHVGGSVVPTELTDREHAMVTALAPRLRQDGLIFVGLDVIGGRLTEVNVTSPTGIQELGRFTNTQPGQQIVAWVERHAQALEPV